MYNNGCTSHGRFATFQYFPDLHWILGLTTGSDRISDVPDVSSLPGLYAESIVQQMKASELLEAEETPDFQSLNLGD